MGKKQIFLCVCMVAFGIMGLLSKAGGPARQLGLTATGAPGEITCLACHDGDGGGGGAITILAPAMASGYEPGTTYSITVQTTDPNAGVGGFQLVALDGSAENAGTLSSPPGSLTQTTSLTAAPNDNIYIEHQTPNIFSLGISSWTFDWTAPPTDVGQVHFYVAGIAADWSGTPEGDDVYLNELVISTLPVEFAGFSATYMEKGPVLLEWATTAEINSDRFELHRSLDGSLFTQIGSREAAGFSEALNNYQYVDMAPVFGTANYYRIKEVDKDGRFQYSDIVSVKVGQPTGGLDKVYPNPAILADHVTASILLTVPGEVEVRLFNMAGNSVFIEKNILPSGLHQLPVPVAGLPSGQYYLETLSGGKADRKKVTVAN